MVSKSQQCSTETEYPKFLWVKIFLQISHILRVQVILADWGYDYKRRSYCVFRFRAQHFIQTQIIRRRKHGVVQSAVNTQTSCRILNDMCLMPDYVKNIRRVIIIGLLGFQWYILVNMRHICTKEFLGRSCTKCCQTCPQHVLSRPPNMSVLSPRH